LSSTHQSIPNDAIKTEGNKLFFLKLTSDLSGLYVCEASNEYGAGIGSLYWQKGKYLLLSFKKQSLSRD